MQIHCNSAFFNSFNTNELLKINFEGKTEQPKHFQIILGHKDINLGSQKYHIAASRIESLKSGDILQNDAVQFASNEGIGLAKLGGGNVLLFSKEFMTKKYNTYGIHGYELTNGSVEYLVYWYDSKDDKEYKVVLPKLRFVKKE